MQITKEQMKKLEALHSGLSHLLHAHYTEVHGVVIDADIAFVDQTTMGEIIQSLHNPSASYTFTLQPLDGPAMIDYALPIAHKFIEKALGEKVNGPVNKEQREALHEVFKCDLDNLLSVWPPVETLTAEHAEFETNPECLDGAIPRSETVILIAFEINGPDFSGLVNVVLPNTTLEPVLEKLDAWTPVWHK